MQYSGSDVLYVPVTQLDLLSRYTAPGDEEKVKLAKLGGAEWQRTRAKVKKATEEMAQELIELYARRRQATGYAFPPDGDWQRDFETRFDYDETDDQLNATAEIKQDMEKGYPMDRLLCGDVGVGKTEVALRAAFKCVMGGKQCAILAPTTLLAWQHYNTILSRMEAFPVKVEMMSRFRTAKQQKETLRGLQSGSVDIVVGTHRLLSKDVKFHDLGLVIIDEEQRFGVKHKEKLKENFIGVDMLTLSATPIPRTLNMAMSGIRDLSTIEQPPIERQPVETFVLEYNDVILAEAMKKELARGGQVYYLHNRVDNIEACAAHVSQMVPGARVGIAHGKMTEEELNPVWQHLLNGEIDILVCTTLIETGIDVRNCNTLIIEDADRMGLAQLYQIRGRVGRSGRKAYAYFTFRRDKTLTDIAQKRLSAIREFTAFGSGFRIAMRDLQIRGAGSLLGHSQHGHMEAVGYDLYVKMLGQAIARAKGEPVQRGQERMPGGPAGGRLHPGEIHRRRPGPHRSLQAHCRHPDPRGRRRRAGRAHRPLRRPAALGERPGERFAGAGAGHRRGRVRGDPEEGHHRAESGTPGCAHDPGPAGGLQRPRHRRCRLKALPFSHPAPRRKAAGTAAEHPQGNGGDFKAR